MLKVKMFLRFILSIKVKISLWKISIHIFFGFCFVSTLNPLLKPFWHIMTEIARQFVVTWTRSFLLIQNKISDTSTKFTGFWILHLGKAIFPFRRKTCFRNVVSSWCRYLIFYILNSTKCCTKISHKDIF